MSLRDAFARQAQGHRHRLLLAVLVLLHLVVLQGVDAPIGQTLFIVHIGLFLLWQPIVHGEKQLSGRELILMASLVVVAVFWVSWGLMVVWVMLLAGIVGGKVFFAGERYARLFYLLALAYLTALLLVLVVPQIVALRQPVTEAFGLLATYGLPALFVVMALLPVRYVAGSRPAVIDFVYSALVFLILAVLVLGTLAFMLLTGRGYGESLLYTLMGMATVLLLLGWAWNPSIGFAGIGVMFSRYMLSRAIPFEDWLRQLTDHALGESEPDAFIDRACRELMRLPGVAGGQWTVRGGAGSFGSPGGRSLRLEHGELAVTLNSRYELSPALAWHLHLLVQLIGEFYLAKARAQQLQELSYVRAVHETGARLTHDVKNLLQSLNMLCFAANREDDNSPAFQALLRRQLPAISQRLQQTLDKLRRPNDELLQQVPAQEWWDELRRRYAQEDVIFTAGVIDAALAIPGNLFTSVAENLLQNALAKRTANPRLAVRVTLDTAPVLVLAVGDDGPAIPQEIAERLFRAPVPSATGLGIGLLQAARQAEVAGFALRLLANTDGRVCIALEQTGGPQG